MQPWIQVFLDTPSDDFEKAIAFWSTATGWTASKRRGEDGQFISLLPDDGPSWLKLQSVEGLGGVHLDLDTTDRAASIAKAQALGAATAWRYHDVEVMRSPGGLVFCQTLVDGSPRIQRTKETILDQVCIDVPEDAWDAETAFWSDLLGRRLIPGLRPEYVYLEPANGIHVLLQRLEESSGNVRAHPDFATSDMESEVRRHLDLGATKIAEFERWTVLTAPGGQDYCVTNRDPVDGTLATQ